MWTRSLRRVVSTLGVVLVVGIGHSAAPAAAATSGVSATDFVFTPAEVAVDTGDTVVWTNTGSVEHTVTADDGAFDSGTIAPGGTYSRTFAAPGVVTYHCTLHGLPGEGMAGQVTVRAAATTTAPPTSAPATTAPPTSTPAVSAPDASPGTAARAAAQPQAPSSAGNAATGAPATPAGDTTLADTGNLPTAAAASLGVVLVALGTWFACAFGSSASRRRRALRLVGLRDGHLRHEVW